MHSTLLAGLLAVGVVLGLGTLVGLWHTRRSGRIRSVRQLGAPPRSGAPERPGDVDSPAGRALAQLGVRPGGPVTLLQFSSAVCAPCRAAGRICASLADRYPGVVHREIDAERHLDEVRALGIWRTPTVLVIDSTGRVAHRVSGVPRDAELAGAIADLLATGVTR